MEEEEAKGQSPGTMNPEEKRRKKERDFPPLAFALLLLIGEEGKIRAVPREFPETIPSKAGLFLARRFLKKEGLVEERWEGNGIQRKVLRLTPKGKEVFEEIRRHFSVEGDVWD